MHRCVIVDQFIISLDCAPDPSAKSCGRGHSMPTPAILVRPPLLVICPASFPPLSFHRWVRHRNVSI